MKLFKYIFVLISLSISVFSQDKAEDEKLIQELVLKSYIEGFVELSNPEAAKKGLHPEFHIVIIKENGVIKFPLAKWIERMNDNPYKANVDCKFEMIDISGRAAVVKIKLSAGNNKFTDYLSCYKFKDGWKIVFAMDNPE